jgi:Primase C terminal 2 (PriCT-2)
LLLHSVDAPSQPSRSGPEHAALKRARALACAFAGADATAVSPAHPLRWPGSWHRKNEPRLARIVDLRSEVEIDPAEAIQQLEPLIPLPRNSGCPRIGPALPPQLDEQDLLALSEVIANADREWADWNRMGMALFAASGGSEASLAAFDRFSRQSAKHDAAETRHRWEHYRRSPPDRLGPGTLVYEARQVDPTFRLPWRGHASPARGPTDEASRQVVQAPERGIADPFNGHIDEFRIAHVQRSGGWIATTWNNMSQGPRSRKAVSRRRCGRLSDGVTPDV